MWISACGRVLFVVVLSFLRTCKGADEEVSCVFMESCILPCSFQIGEDLILHWKTEDRGGLQVHSFYYNHDQYEKQDPLFRNRTSLFNDQIAEGNASLRLRGVKVQDQGRYLCYISHRIPPQSFINLKVNAPVRRVNIQQVEDGLTCSSEGIYPQPHLTWSTRPPSNQSLQITTRVEPTPEQLFNISSSLTAPAADLDHICTVSSGGNNRKATWWRPTSIDGSESGATVPCRSLASHTQLIWRFNHSQVILNQTWTNHMVSKEWTRHVEGPSELINLTLKDLSSDQEGMYTCELSNTEETYVTSTFVMVQKSPGEERNLHVSASPKDAAAIAGGVIGAIASIVIILISICLWKRWRRQQNSSNNNNSSISRTGRQNEVVPLTTLQTDEDQVTPETKESQNCE